MSFSFLIAIFFTTSAFSYAPSIESLLRNNNNDEVTSKSSFVGFKVINQMDQSKNFDLHLGFTQVASGLTLTQGLLENKRFPSFNLMVNQRDPHQAFFYVMIENLLRNNSSILINFLKSKGVNVTFNKERINQKKILLMQKYQKFLQAQKKNPSLTEKDSPLNTKSSEVKEVYNENFYASMQKAQLIKKKDQMQWLVDAGNFEAIYEHDTRRPVQVSFQFNEKKIMMRFYDFYKPDSKHEFPKRIDLKIGDTGLYTLTLSKFGHGAVPVFPITTERANFTIPEFIFNDSKNP
jgi:hypothetical protein